MSQRRKNRKVVKKRGAKNQSQPKTIIVRGIGPPSRSRYTLRFNSSQTMTNVGAPDTNIRFVPTFLYDVNPVLGSTAVPFFTELAGLYRLYRVRSFKVVVGFVNKEAFAVQAWLCPVNTDPGANSGSYQSYVSNPLSRNVTLGPLTGNSAKTLRLPWTSVAGFGGSASTAVLDSYAAPTAGGSPSNNIWVGIGSSTDGSNFTALGVYCTVTIDIEFDLFELLSPSA